MAANSLRQKDLNLKLGQELAQRDTELDLLNSVQQALASRLEVQAIYDLVGDKIREVFNAQVVMISTYDEQTDTIEHRYAIERGERIYAPGKFPNRGFRTQIVETKQPVLVASNVAEKAACFEQPTLPGTLPPKTWMGVPMLVGGHVTGILSLQNVEQEFAFTDSDVRLLQTMAVSLSVALENARLFDETQRLLKESEQRTAELQIINGVQEGLAQKLDTGSIYDLIGNKIRQIYQNADFSIGIYDPAVDELSVPYLIESGVRRNFTPFKVAGKGFIGNLLKNPHTLLINENMEGAVQRYQSEDVSSAGIPKSALYVPLMIGRSVRGEMVLADMHREHAFSQSDVRLLETLAASMSVALETARLWEQEKIYLTGLEHEFEVGREIQAGFLPSFLPQPKGWEIAASLFPAREVAGDFYDVFEFPEGKIGLVIADVCDKGLGAALYMTLFRSFIRSVSNIDFYACVASEYGNAGERIMQAITLTNKYIIETHGDTGMFATIFFGIFDPRTGLLTYINGGHLPPRLIDKKGIKHALTLTGPAIGGLADAKFVLKEVKIEPGETFFAFTDGLTDAENTAGDTFSEKGLIPLFGSGQALSTILTKIHKKLDAFTLGTQQIDDITMLAVRRLNK